MSASPPPAAVRVAALCEPDLPQPIICLACRSEFDERTLRRHQRDECPNCGCEFYGGSGREPRKRERYAEERR